MSSSNDILDSIVIAAESLSVDASPSGAPLSTASRSSSRRGGKGLRELNKVL